MTITIDLRSIQRGLVSGVETYAYHVVEELLRCDTQNKYVLFYNALGKVHIPELHFVNALNVQRRLPNRVLALTTQFNLPKFENYAGETDVVWMPNLNHIALGDKTRFVLTVHDESPFLRPEFYDLKRNIWHQSIRFQRLIKRANAIIAVSEYTKRDLMEAHNVPPGKITVIYEGVNHSAFSVGLDEDRLREIRNRYGLPGEFVLYLGTLEPRKNVAGLIRAFDMMKGDAWLVIAGRAGWKHGEIFDAVALSPKKKKIKLLGFVEEADKPYIMKLARAFAFPSFYEGFGLPVLEAMSVGTPVVTSSVTSLPEIAGDAALLVNPYNIEEIAFALEQLCGDEDLRQMMIEKGLCRAKEFSWQQTAQKTLDVLVGKNMSI